MTRPSRQKSSSRAANEHEKETSLLQAMEDEWLAGRMRGDAKATRTLLAEDYQGLTCDGQMQSKEDFVRSIEQHAFESTPSAEHAERGMRFFGDCAVSTGRVGLRFVGRQHAFRYLRVFRKTGAVGWQLVASQSTRMQNR